MPLLPHGSDAQSLLADLLSATPAPAQEHAARLPHPTALASTDFIFPSPTLESGGVMFGVSGSGNIKAASNSHQTAFNFLDTPQRTGDKAQTGRIGSAVGETAFTQTVNADLCGDADIRVEFALMSRFSFRFYELRRAYSKTRPPLTLLCYRVWKLEILLCAVCL